MTELCFSCSNIFISTDLRLFVLKCSILCFLGIGEYVADPGPSSVSDTTDPLRSIPPYSISTNAMIVNIASPDAVADAVLTLLGNSALRKSLSDAGRRTVASYFTVDRQMKQYETFYRELLSEKLI